MCNVPLFFLNDFLKVFLSLETLSIGMLGGLVSHLYGERDIRPETKLMATPIAWTIAASGCWSSIS